MSHQHVSSKGAAPRARVAQAGSSPSVERIPSSGARPAELRATSTAEGGEPRRLAVRLQSGSMRHLAPARDRTRRRNRQTETEYDQLPDVPRVSVSVSHPRRSERLTVLRVCGCTEAQQDLPKTECRTSASTSTSTSMRLEALPASLLHTRTLSGADHTPAHTQEKGVSPPAYRHHHAPAAQRKAPGAPGSRLFASRRLARGAFAGFRAS